MKTKVAPQSSRFSKARSWRLTSPFPDSLLLTTPASALGLIRTDSGILSLPTRLLDQSEASRLAAEPQWRSSSYNFAGTLTPENIEEAFDDIIELDLNRSSDGQASPKPTVIFAGRNIYRMHKAAARDKSDHPARRNRNWQEAHQPRHRRNDSQRHPASVRREASAERRLLRQRRVSDPPRSPWRQHEDQAARRSLGHGCLWPSRRMGRSALHLAAVPHPCVPDQLMYESYND